MKRDDVVHGYYLLKQLRRMAELEHLVTTYDDDKRDFGEQYGILRIISGYYDAEMIAAIKDAVLAEVEKREQRIRQQLTGMGVEI